MASSSCNSTVNVGPPDWFGSFSGAVCTIPVSGNVETYNTFTTCCAITLNATQHSAPTNWTSITSKPDKTVGLLTGQFGCQFQYCDVSYANTSKPQGEAMSVFKKCLNDAAPETTNSTGCMSTVPQGTTTTPSGAVAVTASKAGLLLFLVGMASLIL